MAAHADIPHIVRGWVHALYAYEVGQSIDLDEAQRRITSLTERAALKHKRRAPRYLAFQPPPLRVLQHGTVLTVGAHRTEPQIDLVLFDFGAVSVTYAMPLAGPMETLLDLSVTLYDDQSLLADSRRRVAELLGIIGAAVTRPRVADIDESYVIYQLQDLAGAEISSDTLLAHAPFFAQVLRAERESLSPQEVHDAVACRLAFGRADLTLIDGDAAIVIEPNAEDIIAVLEFANVELLEMHYLDHKLDAALDEAYRALSRSTWLRRRAAREDLDRIARMQVDGALLFEGVNNAFKLIGDQFLARVYRLASERFHLADWDASILRKLQTLEGIYSKVSDAATNRRMEALEWIIIALIALELVLSFTRH
jgi:hypothetical protein